MSSAGLTDGAGREERPALVAVWDPFVRVFHWSLVTAFAVAWISADEWDRLHEITGYAIGILVMARLVWGVIGTRHARFTDFVTSPSAVIRYLRDILGMRAKRYLGHNPAGGAMIVALLVMLSLTAGSGLLMVQSTPSPEWIEDAHEVLANLTLALVIAHVAGVVAASLMHGENLVKAMITGSKRREP